MRIADMFMFHDELDLLRVRLAEHSHFVDRFYLVEANRTFRYGSKRLYFAEHRHEFADWLDRIEHVVVDTDRLFVPDDAFGNERRQRAFLQQRNPGVFDNYDYVLSLDADEIIDRRRFGPVRTLMQMDAPAIAPALDLYFYFLNVELQRPWTATRIFRVGGGRAPDLSLAHGGVPTPSTVGWHFSFLGGPARVRRKIESFSHVEFDLPEYADERQIAQRMLNLEQPFGPDSVYAQYGRLTPRPPGDWLPVSIHQRLEAWRPYLYEVGAPRDWAPAACTPADETLRVRQLATRVREQEARLHEIAAWANSHVPAITERDAEISRLQQALAEGVASRDAEIQRLQHVLADAASIRDAEIQRLQQALVDGAKIRDAEIQRLQHVLADAVSIRDAEIQRLQEALEDGVKIRDAEIQRLQQVLVDAVATRDAEIHRLQQAFASR